jgi:hypothetical protein
MQITRVEAIRNAAIGATQAHGLLADRPFAGERPFIECKATGRGIDARPVRSGS